MPARLNSIPSNVANFKLNKITLSAPATTISFDVPPGYSKIIGYFDLYGSLGSTGFVAARFNADAGNNYAYAGNSCSSAGVAGTVSNTTTIWAVISAGSLAGASYACKGSFTVHNDDTVSNARLMQASSSIISNVVECNINTVNSIWKNTTKITNITLHIDVGNFGTGSSITYYGVI